MKGIDISSNNHNGEVFNFLQVKEAGYEVVYVKATQGNNYLNPYLIADVRDAANNGLHVGVYHFYDPAHGTPQEQADWFLRNGVHAPVGETGRDLTEFLTLLPVLDLEVGLDPAHPERTTAARDEFIVAMNLAHYRCGVYMNRSYRDAIGYGQLAAFGWLAWPEWTNEALPSVTAIVQTAQTLVQGIGENPNGSQSACDVNTITDFAAIEMSVQQPTTEREHEMDAVVAPNGDIVSHVVSVDGHYLEVTRKAGEQGKPMTFANTQIIDVNAAFGSEKPVQP